MFGGTEIKNSPEEYVEEVRKNLEQAYENVRARMKMVQKRQQDYYNQHTSGKPYEKGDHVWLYTPCTGKAWSKKLYRPLSGPYRVVKKSSDGVYRIQLIGGRKRRVVNFNRLKPCVNEQRH